MKTATGLCDSDGNMLFVGDRIRMVVTANKGLHGEWAEYEIEMRGIVPVIFYKWSEKGLA